MAKIMNDLSVLSDLLRVAIDLSDDELILTSDDLTTKTSVLNDFGIIYVAQAEGIQIDLSNQNILIYKTKNDAIKYLSDDSFNAPILILEDNLIYQVEMDSPPTFFENILYWHTLKSLLIKHKVSSHNDELLEQLIFLSEKYGKLEVGYKCETSDFFDKDHALAENYFNIKEKIESDSEFISIFRDNFIKVACETDDIDQRYTASLNLIRRIYDNAEREFSLYKNKFSFEDFKSDLDKETESYLKEYQSDLTSFLLNVGSLPLQFGVYIYLMMKFSEQLIPLVAVLILILVWSLFSLYSIKQIIDNVLYIKESVEFNFNNLSDSSGLPSEQLEPDRSLILSRIEKTLNMLGFYRRLVFLFSLVVCITGGYLIGDLI